MERRRSLRLIQAFFELAPLKVFWWNVAFLPYKLCPQSAGQ